MLTTVRASKNGRQLDKEQGDDNEDSDDVEATFVPLHGGRVLLLLLYLLPRPSPLSFVLLVRDVRDLPPSTHTLLLNLSW